MITELNPKEEYKKSFTDLNTLKEELENNPFGKVVLYIEEDSVIAYLYYSEIYERVEINNIEVEPDFRNKGIGTELLRYLTETTDQKSISLEVKKELSKINNLNNKEMTKLYTYTNRINNSKNLFWNRYFACHENDEGR